jgi:uncharacterized protein (TIGR02246 family)
MPANLTESAAALTAEWAASWNTHDMSRMARLLADDADWVTVGGRHLQGRAEVERVHAALHQASLRYSVWTNRSFRVEPLSDSVALLHLNWSVQGDLDPDGTPRQPRDGVFTWVLVASAGGWRIRAAHATNVVAP